MRPAQLKLQRSSRRVGCRTRSFLHARSRSEPCRDVSARSKGFGILELAGTIPQGPLVSGVKKAWNATWVAFMQELAPQDAKGGYQRPSYAFDGRIGDSKFPIEKGRYHLYVGNACPWCHRVLLAVALLNLSEYISFTWLLDDAERASRGGWIFDSRTGPDPLFGAADLREVYDQCSPGFKGRCTAPLLVDKLQRKAVCNESGLMLDCFYDLAAAVSTTDRVLKPSAMRADIDALNDFVYRNVNNATYRSGFATSQAAYDEAQRDLEEGLNHVNSVLTKQRFLLGDTFTDADLRLFPTIVRYDAVYNSLFKCTRRRIASDCPAIQKWMRDVWMLPSEGPLQVADTYDVDAARRSYFGQLFPLNPSGIVPSGPTASDLGLGTDPGRGAQDESVFATRATASVRG